MKNKRTPSKIVVCVVDLTKEAKKALEIYNKSHEMKATSMDVDYQWGYVKTAKGVYFLCHEGVGSSHPITAKNSAQVGFYPMFESSHGLFPGVLVSMDDKDILALRVKKKVKLNNFIRRFGDRLETNYSRWQRHLEAA